MEKITEKQTEVETALSEISGCPMPQLDPRVLEVYKGVREVKAKQLCPVAAAPAGPQGACPHPRPAQTAPGLCHASRQQSLQAPPIPPYLLAAGRAMGMAKARGSGG